MIANAAEKRFVMDFLCLDFINSRFVGEDESGEPAAHNVWLRKLCLRWNLPEPDVSVQARLYTLRDLLYRAACEYGTTGSIAVVILDSLNEQLKTISFHNRLEQSDAGFHISAIAQYNEKLLLPYRIVMSFADLVSNHDAGRVKVCENPDCGWVFYDESKSRTRRWCANTCASLIKVRRFRKKHSGT